MDISHAHADSIRNQYANQSSSSNVTSTGQSATDSINNSSSGYLYPDTWNESQSGTNVNNGSTNSSKDTNNVSDDEPIHKSTTLKPASSGNVKSEEITAMDSLYSFNAGLIRALDDTLTGGTLAFILKEAREFITGERITYSKGEDEEAYYLGRVVGDIVGILAGAYGAAVTVEFLINMLAGGIAGATALLSGGGSIAGEGISIMGGELVLGGAVVAGSTGGLSGFSKDLKKYLELSGESRGSSEWSSAKELTGKEFEDYLTKQLGGDGSFKKGGREFDGSVDNRWWEAKSGGYWDMIQRNENKLNNFKTEMGQRLGIANDNGATFELFTNSPIPESIKNWLTGKGIAYTEILH